MEAIRFEYRSRRTKFTIEAWVDGNRKAGELEYRIPRRITDAIELNGLLVKERYRRRGIGGQLIQEFVRSVGPGRRVVTVITNNESLKMLESLEPEREDDKAAIVHLTDQSVLRTLPIVRVSNSGSLKHLSVRIQYNPRKVARHSRFSIYEARAEAITV